MTENKTGYKYKISFNQSVSSGIIGFSGEVNFDHPSEEGKDVLRKMLETQEKEFRGEGYKVASDITPKEKEVKDKK